MQLKTFFSSASRPRYEYVGMEGNCKKFRPRCVIFYSSAHTRSCQISGFMKVDSADQHTSHLHVVFPIQFLENSSSCSPVLSVPRVSPTVVT